MLDIKHNLEVVSTAAAAFPRWDFENHLGGVLYEAVNAHYNTANAKDHELDSRL